MVFTTGRTKHCKWLAWQNIKTRNLNNRIQSCQLSSWTWLRTKANSPMNQSKKTLATTNCGGSKISLNFWQLCCQVKSANSCRYQWYHGDKLHDFPFFPFFPFRFQWFSVLKFARFNVLHTSSFRLYAYLGYERVIHNTACLLHPGVSCRKCA